MRRYLSITAVAVFLYCVIGKVNVFSLGIKISCLTRGVWSMILSYTTLGTGLSVKAERTFFDSSMSVSDVQDGSRML